MKFAKRLLKKLGIDLDQEYRCIKCKKPMSTKEKRCPHCRAWNDCCSIDPELLHPTKKKMNKEKISND